MKKCYNKKCPDFNCRRLFNCNKRLEYFKTCTRKKFKIAKEVILKMAYAFVKQECLIFEIDNLDNWSFRCCQSWEDPGNASSNGKGFESLYHKCKELLK